MCQCNYSIRFLYRQETLWALECAVVVRITDLVRRVVAETLEAERMPAPRNGVIPFVAAAGFIGRFQANGALCWWGDGEKAQGEGNRAIPIPRRV